MAFDWVIDSKEKRITVCAEDEFTFADMVNYLDAIAGANVLAYRQLLDVSKALSKITPGEAIELGVRMRMQNEAAETGPVAVVLTEHQFEPLARLLGIMATADRPMRLFTQLESAKRWIASAPTGEATGATAEPQSEPMYSKLASSTKRKGPHTPLRTPPPRH